MTLNITVLSDSAIHQSSDFILWDADAKAPVSISSTKLIRVTSIDGLTASVAFAGVGRVAQTDTADIVVSWLTGSPVSTFEGFVAVLQAEGTRWLRDVKRRNGTLLHHTFVAAAFVGGVATAAYVSNFESARGPRQSDPWDELRVSTVVADRGPVALVTGCVRPSVSRQQRNLLEGIAQSHPNDWGRVRLAMIELNRAASRSGGETCPVSEESVATSFDRHGAGAEGAMAPGAETKMVMGGIDVGSMLQAVAAELFPAGYQVRGSTMGSTTAAAAAAADPTTCEPALSIFPCSPDFELFELHGNLGGRGDAKHANTAGLIAGHGAAAHLGPSLPVRWSKGQDAEFLDGLGGITGQVQHVTDAGMVIGGVEDPDRRLVAVRWNPEGALERLVEPEVSHSLAIHANFAGDIVGWVSIHASGGEQAHHRPALWQRDGTMKVLEDLPSEAEWGLAVGVNSSGQILVNLWAGQHFTPALWDGVEIWLLAPQEQRVVGVGILDSGDVVGWIQQAEGPLALIWTSSSRTWIPMGTAPGWLVTAVSANGHAAGRVEVEGWLRPWVKAPGAEAVVVPHYAYHHHEVRGINDDGTAAGHAQDDHGHHPLIWSNRSQTTAQ